MSIPKISIPKIDLSSVKTTVTNAAAAGVEYAKNAPRAAVALARDTVDLAKASPKQAVMIAGAGAVAIAALTGIVKAAKSGVEHIAARKD